MKTKALITLFVASFSFNNMGVAERLKGVDDSDLTRGEPKFLMVEKLLRPDAIVEIEKRKDLQVEFQFLYERNQKWVPISGLVFEGVATDEFGKVLLSCTKQNIWKTKLATDNFRVGDRRSAYEIEVDAECGRVYEVQFAEDTEVGQAVSIFETFQRGQLKLEASVGLGFWTKQLPVIWPSNGDYYSWGTVHITNGHHWDVVAHEMGHAIYDFGNLGQFGGGPHKIDECYSKNLALSEGWASFYAAWLYIELADSDAKFQYLVPRRAPIRIENIPEDVCRDTTNEWRVTGFFWDVVDLSRDQEEVEQSFRVTWEALLNSNVGSVEAAKSRLESKGIGKNQLERAWSQNF